LKRIIQFILDKAHCGIHLPDSYHPIPKDPKLLIFDFDGTIADTFKNSVEILNEMAPEFGYRPLLGNDVKAAQDMTTRQLMRYLGISTTRLPRIALRGVKLLHSRINQIQPISGVPELLNKLQDTGIPMGILTSNSHENVMSFLQRYQLEVFTFIRSSSRLLGKAREIKTILRDHQLNAEEVLFIGDETRDVEAAHRTKVPIVAVSWGYNSLKALTAQKPQATIKHPAELLNILSL
jgi:phosphoglycolate phosphatase